MAGESTCWMPAFLLPMRGKKSLVNQSSIAGWLPTCFPKDYKERSGNDPTKLENGKVRFTQTQNMHNH